MEQSQPPPNNPNRDKSVNWQQFHIPSILECQKLEAECTAKFGKYWWDYMIQYPNPITVVHSLSPADEDEDKDEDNV